MQRVAHWFNEEELLIAGERGWGKKFDGKEDATYSQFAYCRLALIESEDCLFAIRESQLCEIRIRRIALGPHELQG